METLNKRILILSDPNSNHTFKWVRALSLKGFKIFLFGLTPFQSNQYAGIDNLEVVSMEMKLSNTQVTGTRLTKLKYLSALPKLKKIIEDFKPQVVHAHYATSYGLLGALSGRHPFIISLWGSDVFDFPKKSILYQNIFQFVLNRADAVLSTSKVMALEASKYYKKDITVVPFGVDTDLFDRVNVESLFGDKDYVIGIAKNLEDIYGIDVLLKSFAILKSRVKGKSLKLLIIGTGTKAAKLKHLAKELLIDKETIFMGQIKNDELPKYYSMMNIAVFLSRHESFGVAALEAMSCSVPVIASDIGGFREIINNNKTGILVEPDNPEKAASEMGRILFDDQLAYDIGRSARQKVIKDYNLEDSLNLMLSVYGRFIK